MFMTCVMNGIKHRRYKKVKISQQNISTKIKESHLTATRIQTAFAVLILDSSLFARVHAYSMCSFSTAFKTLQRLIFCPSPPSFWHVPTRSALCHGNRGGGWHHTFGRAGRWWWWKGETVTVHWILCNQDPGDSIALSGEGVKNREWRESSIVYPSKKKQQQQKQTKPSVSQFHVNSALYFPKDNE